ncbi:MAG: methyltransferase domain-containing protein [Leptolyngbya sp. SIO1E4]|nr:methyltransferase domain-containing protein [Leptolyngbya sp. SIO1E4]
MVILLLSKAFGFVSQLFNFHKGIADVSESLSFEDEVGLDKNEISLDENEAGPDENEANSNNPWNADEAVTYDGIWLGCNECAKNIQRKVTGDENTHWLSYTIQNYLAEAIGKKPSNKAQTSYRCLILGANEGWIERELCKNGFSGEIIASDIADKALSRAAEKSQELGYKNVKYIVADLNGDLEEFDGMFDFIIFEGVLHHIENIENCLQILKSKLVNGGLMFGVEHHGPFRFQLPDYQVRWINAALAVLPKTLRPFPRNQEGNYPATPQENMRIFYVPPSEEAIRAWDPSEAISGFKLQDLFSETFEVLERRGFGGTILSYMSGHFDFKRANQDDFANSWLKILMQIEDTLIQTGLLDDEFIFWTLKNNG